VNLYLRLLKVLLLFVFVRRKGLFEAGCVTFRVWPNDCDLNLHPDPARQFLNKGESNELAGLAKMARACRVNGENH